MAERASKKAGRLTIKRRRFVEAYLTTWNATDAARQAGYSYPGKVGPRLTKVPAIRDAIQERIEAVAMGADEVLMRLAEQARASIGDYLTETGEIDWKKVRATGHLVKSAARNSRGDRIELYDGQAALVHIGRHLALFVDKLEVEDKTAAPAFKQGELERAARIVVAFEEQIRKRFVAGDDGKQQS